ncbi:MAG: hypothetical protein ACI4M1_03500 [Christensenellales bacterium]
MKGILSTLIILIIFFCTLATWTANTYTDYVCDENKIYCQATLEDDFKADTVVVVLNQKNLKDIKSYTISDFKEIECEKVTNLTGCLVEIIKGKIADNPFASSKKIKDIIAKEALININNFCL